MKHFAVFLVILFIYSSAAAEGLKIGLLQIEDSVPFYVAEKEGFYQQEEVQVELVPFLSALERDSALTAGAIDGAISDPIGALLLDKGLWCRFRSWQCPSSFPCNEGCRSKSHVHLQKFSPVWWGAEVEGIEWPCSGWA